MAIHQKCETQPIGIFFLGASNRTIVPLVFDPDLPVTYRNSGVLGWAKLAR
jgi:hypothetical protein